MSGAAGPAACPPVAVIVLNYNGRQWIADCLAALTRQTYPAYRVIVIDNASTDGSAAIVRERFPTVTLIPFAENLGFGRAYNRAIAAVPEPLVALANHDTIPDPGWLAALVADLTRDPAIAACTSRIRFVDRPGLLNHAGATLTYAGTGWDRGFGQPDGEAFDAPGPTGCFSGAAALIRRDAFLAVGGFDDRFFAYCEDSDLSWRLWLAGYQLRYTPGAIARHVYGGSGGPRRSAFRIAHAQQNRILSFWKNAGLSRLPLAVAASIAFDLYRTYLYLREGRFDLIGSLIAGTWAAARQVPGAWADRRRIQRSRRRSDADLERLGVIATPAAAIREYLRLEAARRTPAGPPERAPADREAITP